MTVLSNRLFSRSKQGTKQLAVRLSTFCGISPSLRTSSTTDKAHSSEPSCANNVGRYITYLLLSFCMVGCSSLPELPFLSGDDKPRGSGTWERQKEALANLNRWHIKGKIGVSTPEDRASGFIDWKQNKQNYAIRVSGTFGLGTTYMQGDDTGMVVKSKDVNNHFTPQPEEMLESAFGWSVPIEYLRYWIRALPSPLEDYEIQYNEEGLPLRISQGEWNLSYSKFTEYPPGILVPGKVVVERPGYKLTLVPKSWLLNDWND